MPDVELNPKDEFWVDPAKLDPGSQQFTRTRRMTASPKCVEVASSQITPLTLTSIIHSDME